MNEHKCRECAKFDPLSRPLLPWRSSRNFNPIALRRHPTDDWIVHSGLGRLCGHFDNYRGDFGQSGNIGNVGKETFIQHNNVVRTQSKQLAYILI